MNALAPALTTPPPARAGAAAVRLQILLAGSQALRALGAGARGKVAAVFRRAFLLETNEGDWICIASPGIGGGPLNALVARPEGGPAWKNLAATGHPFTVTADAVHIGERLILGLRGAAPWQPPLPSGPWRPALLPGHLHRLQNAARLAAPETGLGFLLSGGHPEVGDAAQHELARRALDAAAALRRWLCASLADAADGEDGPVLTPPPSRAAALLGLGPGLTPSGDDLLCGVLLALHTIGRPRVARTLADWALPLARQRTTPLSAAHLAAAARGEGAEALHRLLRGLGRDPGWQPERPLAEPLFGDHTSGWDALAGLWLVLTALTGDTGRSTLDASASETGTARFPP